MLRYSLCTIATLAFIAVSHISFAQQYTMIDCGTLVGSTSFADIGDGGQAVWTAANVGGSGYVYTPYSYINGAFSNLSQTHGLTNTEVRGINSENVIVGYGGAFDARGFFLKGNTITDISLSPFGTASRMHPFAINNNGDVAIGYSFGSAVNYNVNSQTGFFVNPLQDFLTAEAHAINSSGVMAGYGYVSAPGGGSHRRAALWNGLAPVNLGGLSDRESVAQGINDHQTVVGFSDNGEKIVPFIYRDGVMSELASSSLFDIGGLSRAKDVNNDGLVVGRYSSQGNTRGFLWTQQSGLVSLQSLVSNSNGLIINDAFAINESGWIVANGFNPNGGTNHAILLAPVPEPTTIVSLGSLLAFLRLRRSRQK